MLVMIELVLTIILLTYDVVDSEAGTTENFKHRVVKIDSAGITKIFAHGVMSAMIGLVWTRILITYDVGVGTTVICGVGEAGITKNFNRGVFLVLMELVLLIFLRNDVGTLVGSRYGDIIISRQRNVTKSLL